MKSAKILATLAATIVAISFVPMAQAQIESVIYSFTGGRDGAGPNPGLIADAAGNLYGTTFNGGNSGPCGTGCGVVYKLSPSASGWTQTVLHTFTSGADGANPGGGLILGIDGNLYGTAAAGGSANCPGGCGVVFRFVPTTSGWKEQVLHAFTGVDGFAPYYKLATDSKGNLYGVTLAGGNLVNCASHTYGCGVAFRLARQNAGWQFQLLFNFTDSDDSAPSTGLILDAAGTLYGSGVAGSGGVIYRLSPTSSGFWQNTVLYSFSGTDGYLPQGLVFGPGGNLYGSTYQGGTGGGLTLCQESQPGCGTVFQLSVRSNAVGEAVLHNFTGQDANPNGGLISDAAANLYGADSHDVFELSRLGVTGTWKKTSLHTFNGGSDGLSPRAPLFLYGTGDLFGVTYEGGTSGKGVVFEITP